MHLGAFSTELEAARVYDMAALRLLGTGAELNLDPVGAAAGLAEINGHSLDENEFVRALRRHGKGAQQGGSERAPRDSKARAALSGVPPASVQHMRALSQPVLAMPAQGPPVSRSYTEPAAGGLALLRPLNAEAVPMPTPFQLALQRVGPTPAPVPLSGFLEALGAQVLLETLLPRAQQAAVPLPIQTAHAAPTPLFKPHPARSHWREYQH